MTVQKNILILGAKGMLGQALASVFSDCQSILWDRDDIDISNALDIQSKIPPLGVQWIINAAARNGVDGCETEPEKSKAYAVNGQSLSVLTKIANESNAGLVHFSTDYVFDGSKKEGYTESDDPRPISEYGKSKFIGEQHVTRAANHFYLIRLSRLFGQEAISKTGKKSFVNMMIDLGIHQKKVLNVIDEEHSCPTYGNDLAIATRRLIEEGYPNGIYHASNEGACTWFEFAKEIFRLLDVPVAMRPVPSSFYRRQAKRPRWSRLVNTKGPKMRSWRIALANYLQAQCLA